MVRELSSGPRADAGGVTATLTATDKMILNDLESSGALMTCGMITLDNR